MHKDHTYQYNFSVIEKYLNGELSPAEMHALEKAALQDPFLADAIEGYQQANLTTSNSHLAEIQQLIAGGEEKGRVLPFMQPRLKWFRIAAILVLIAGVATISWLLIKTSSSIAPALVNNKQSTLPLSTKTPDTEAIAVVTEKELSIKQKENILTSIPKTNATDNERIEADRLFDAQKNTSDVPLKSLLSRQESLKKQFLTDSLKNTQLQQMSASVQAKTFNYDQALQGKVAGVLVTNSKTPYLIRGTVMDSLQNPLAHASIQAGTAKKVVTTNADGSFQLNSKDSAVTATVTALGYQSAQTSLLAGTLNPVKLNNDSSALEEVVVVGYARQRKREMTGSVKRIENLKADSSKIQPLGGMQSFIHSLQVKWNAAKWDGSALKGTIVCILSFNEKGQVKKVVFEGSLDRQFKKRLTKLLTEGTGWVENTVPAKGKHRVMLVF